MRLVKRGSRSLKGNRLQVYQKIRYYKENTVVLVDEMKFD